jgi:trimethylamine:corrinoid methyltransferase-like protein
MPSEVIDRDYRQTWFGKGALDVNARAHGRVEELIEAYEASPVADDVVHELEAIATRHAKDAGLDQLPELSAQ